MKDKLKAHFLKFGPRRFVIFASLSLLITDLINGYYLKLYWQAKELSERFVTLSILRSGGDLSDFSTSTFAEMLGFVDNMFYFFLLIILINNAFFYFFYLRKKLWAQGFILFYTLTACLMSFTLVIDNAGLGAGWLIYNILTLPYYVYVYFGVKLLKEETTLGHEKKAR